MNRPGPFVASSEAASGDPKALAAALRAKLDAAILAEAWDAVKAIKARVDELEREGVIDLERERHRRR